MTKGEPSQYCFASKPYPEHLDEHNPLTRGDDASIVVRVIFVQQSQSWYVAVCPYDAGLA